MIDLNDSGQLNLVTELARFSDDVDIWPAAAGAGFRYHYENAYFGFGDAIVLHCLLRHLRTRKLIEIGSGFSSALILDVNERFLGGRLRCTFIEPDPDRLLNLLRPADRLTTELLVARLQDVDLDFGAQLGAGDILFVDSSHVSRPGSDVDKLISSILPSLQRGVYVHIHDIFSGFEYPEAWAEREWNEAPALRVFLENEPSYKITLFNSHLAEYHREKVAALLPLWGKNPGGIPVVEEGIGNGLQALVVGYNLDHECSWRRRSRNCRRRSRWRGGEQGS